MTLLYLILLIAAAVCFGMAAFASNRRGRGRVNLMALGLLLWVLVPLLQTLDRSALT
jgi:hypothetical protein